MSPNHRSPARVHRGIESGGIQGMVPDLEVFAGLQPLVPQSADDLTDQQQGLPVVLGELAEAQS